MIMAIHGDILLEIHINQDLEVMIGILENQEEKGYYNNIQYLISNY